MKALKSNKCRLYVFTSHLSSSHLLVEMTFTIDMFTVHLGVLQIDFFLLCYYSEECTALYLHIYSINVLSSTIINTSVNRIKNSC